MQTTGYIQIDGKKILVLARTGKKYRSLKRRQSGKDGIHFTDEEAYLNENQERLKKLLRDEVIFL